MRFFPFVVCLFLLFACSQDSTPEHCRHADRIMKQFVNDAEKQYKLVCYGSGGAFFEQVNEIFFSFVTLGPKSLEELRVVMITITEDFLNRINNDEEIRQSLANFPFEPNNLKFRISLMSKDGKFIINKGAGKELLRSVLLLKGKLSYEIENEETAGLQDVHEETYEEALSSMLNELR